jgi:hypothetical protein
MVIELRAGGFASWERAGIGWKSKPSLEVFKCKKFSGLALAVRLLLHLPMPPDEHRTIPHDEREADGARYHSAVEEFRRDERRPAVLLLCALVIAAAFFAFGILLGRWMADADHNKASVRRPPETVNGSSATPSATRPRP